MTMIRYPETVSTPQFVIMAKEPIPGRVNTRLIRPDGVTADDAARIARAMLMCCIRRFRARGPVVVAVSPDDAATRMAADLDPASAVRWVGQGDGSLGDRIVRVWSALGGGSAAFFGIDTPHMPSAALDDLLDGLSSNESVIGPTADGGYWSIGCPTFQPHLFRDIDWGGDSVYDQSVLRLTESGLAWRSLPRWVDVDEPDDLRDLSNRLHHQLAANGLSDVDRDAYECLLEELANISMLL
ncbi:MAG: DUF2064 domain-containing protein [Planctomycetota bacterium]